MNDPKNEETILYVVFRDYFWGWLVYVVQIQGGIAHAYREKRPGEWSTIPVGWFSDRKKYLREREMTPDEIRHYTSLMPETLKGGLITN